MIYDHIDMTRLFYKFTQRVNEHLYFFRCEQPVHLRSLRVINHKSRIIHYTSGCSPIMCISSRIPTMHTEVTFLPEL